MPTVAFIHLDLGIGGAENLVVNAAKGIQDRGHSVKIFTSHHDPGRAFKETIDGTLSVKVYGQWIPRQLFGRLTILLSTVRMLWVCFMMLLHGESADLVITDQVSSVNAVVRLYGLAKRKLVFYCHYPDLLLCTERGSWLKRMYRVPFDWLERSTTAMCDVLLVNSQFTASTLARTFPNINSKVHVLYPPIDMRAVAIEAPGQTRGRYFLSLNRYERKKDLGLAIEAFEDFVRSRKPGPDDVQLIMAGGYDARLSENVEYFKELEALIARGGLVGRVVMLKNISDAERIGFLAHAEAVIYTPQFEHFGIVPCEAMALGTPVIAWNNGGPKESVLDGRTGWLCVDRSEFGKAISKSLNRSVKNRTEMSAACKKRVDSKFSLSAFAQSLASLLDL